MAQHGGDLFALGDDGASEPTFEVALRGYDRRQVERYVQQVEAEVTTFATEREQAYAQAQALAVQVEQLQAELADLRRRSISPEKISFRHLGARVEQILGLAEDQAEAIRADAVGEVEERGKEADRVLAEARAKAAHAISDFEIALAARRAEEEKTDRRRRQRPSGAGRDQSEETEAAAQEAAKTKSPSSTPPGCARSPGHACRRPAGSPAGHRGDQAVRGARPRRIGDLRTLRPDAGPAGSAVARHGGKGDRPAAGPGRAGARAVAGPMPSGSWASGGCRPSRSCGNGVRRPSTRWASCGPKPRGTRLSCAARPTSR